MLGLKPKNIEGAGYAWSGQRRLCSSLSGTSTLPLFLHLHSWLPDSSSYLKPGFQFTALF